MYRHNNLDSYNDYPLSVGLHQEGCVHSHTGPTAQHCGGLLPNDLGEISECCRHADTADRRRGRQSEITDL